MPPPRWSTKSHPVISSRRRQSSPPGWAPATSGRYRGIPDGQCDFAAAVCLLASATQSSAIRQGALWPVPQFVVKGAQNPDAAYAFIDTMFATDAQYEYGKATGSVPSIAAARAKLADDPDVKGSAVRRRRRYGSRLPDRLVASGREEVARYLDPASQALGRCAGAVCALHASGPVLRIAVTRRSSNGEFVAAARGLQDLRRDEPLSKISPRRRPGRVHRPARSLGLRQDNHAAHDRRLRRADLGLDLHRRPTM